MEKKKRKYRDVESMTDEEFEALTMEIAGPRADNHEPQYDLRYTERHDNPTPSGGDYSIAFYYNERHNPCIREDAWFINIVEYTADGRRINETYGMTDRALLEDS